MSTSLAGRLRAHVERLAAEPRPPRTPAHQAARNYVVEQLQKAGFRVKQRVQQGAGLECFNVLTDPEPHGDRRPLVIVGAHYDSVPESPGADDNASAVATLLELAHWVRPKLESSLQASLQLVAYDLEEYGLVGSFLHSRELALANVTVRGMIALEMLGFTDPRPGSQRLPLGLEGRYPNIGTFIAVIGNEPSTALVDVVAGSLKQVAGLPVECMMVPADGRLLSETRLSDHSSFWDRGFSAVMITDTSFFRNSHYHKASDTPETLDYNFLARVTEGVCLGTLQLLR